MNYELKIITITKDNYPSLFDTFNLIDINRTVQTKTSHFKNLKASIKEIRNGHRYIIQPIVAFPLNGMLQVIDGQHRLTAVLDLIIKGDIDTFDLPVLVNKYASKYDIIDANNTSRNWDNMEYIESYANDGDLDAINALGLVNHVYAGTGFGAAAILNAFMDRKSGQVKTILSHGKGNYKVNEEKGNKILKGLKSLHSVCDKAIGSKPVEALKKMVWEVEDLNIDKLKSRLRELDAETVSDIFQLNQSSEMSKRLLTIYNK